MARENFIDRSPTFPGRFEMTKADGSIEIVSLVRDDEPSVEGTKLDAKHLNNLAQFADFSAADFTIDSSKQIRLKNAGGSGEGGSDYTNTAMIWRINHNLSDIVICDLSNADDIDTAFFDGASVIENYYNAEKGEINKTDSDSISFCTPSFEFPGHITAVAYSIDGTGDISASISFDNGETWSELSEGKNKISASNAIARIKFTIGECLIKNFCWGVTMYE